MLTAKEAKKLTITTDINAVLDSIKEAASCSGVTELYLFKPISDSVFSKLLDLGYQIGVCNGSMRIKWDHVEIDEETKKLMLDGPK